MQVWQVLQYSRWYCFGFHLQVQPCPGCGILTNAALNGDATSLSGLILSSTSTGLPFVYYVPQAGPDLVADCSDEYPDCAANAFDCAGECGGSAEVDECGICDGDGIADGACDCDGNELDCAGVCGGTSIEVTLCEDTDGDGLGNPGSETTECVDGGRDVTDGCDLPDFNLFLGPNGEVFYNSSEAIGGFQFNVDGATVSAASGGDAGAAGFAVSPGGNTVLGFSFTGATFGPGCGILTNLALNGDATSLSGLILSSATGAGLPFVYYVPQAGPDLVADCSDEYPDCAANAFDCAGECGGSAEIDECGVCGGDGIADGACDCEGNVDLGCGCGEDAAEENFDCDGNCLVDFDCAIVCGGSAVEDECGECGGDGIAEGACDCDGNVDLGCGCGEAGPSGCDEACVVQH